MMHDTNSLLNRAQRCASRGETADAESLFRQALQASPHDPDVHIGLARLRAANGDRDVAASALVATARAWAPVATDTAPVYALLSEALQLAPHQLELHIDLAEVQAAAGDTHGAVARLVRLSTVYCKEGRFEDARAVLEFPRDWKPQTSVAGVIEAPNVDDPPVVFRARPPARVRVSSS